MEKKENTLEAAKVVLRRVSREFSRGQDRNTSFEIYYVNIRKEKHVGYVKYLPRPAPSLPMPVVSGAATVAE